MAGRLHSLLRNRRWGRRSLGPEEVRRINFQKIVLTADRGGGNKMLVDVVGPYVLPDASAEADSMISLLAATPRRSSASCPIGCTPGPPKRYALDPHPMHDHRQPASHGNLSAHLAPSAGDLDTPSLQPTPALNPPRTLRVVGGGSAAGPSHSRKPPAAASLTSSLVHEERIPVSRAAHRLLRAERKY
jgi:hypothetical protein